MLKARLEGSTAPQLPSPSLRFAQWGEESGESSACRKNAWAEQAEMLGPILETLIGGLLTGVLYALVALGFVLIFKASGVFNFAQGAMVLFAALALARLAEVMALVVSIALTLAIMIA